MDNILDSIHQWIDGLTIMGVTTTVVTVLSIISMIVIVTFCSRFVLRYCHHVIRQKINLGGLDMEWNEVIFTSEINESEVEKAVGQVANMANLTYPTTSRWLNIFHWNRALVSFMLRRSKDDESARLYIGIDKKHYGNGSDIRAWTQGSNCEVEKIDFDDIGFINAAPVTVTVKDYIPQKYTDAPTNSSVGAAMSRFQNLFNNGHGGTALMTYEPMRPDERNTYQSFLVDQSVRDGRSSDTGYNPVGNYTEYFTSNSPCRGVILGFSDDGIYSDSEAIVNTITNSLTSLGVQTDTRRYPDVNRAAGLACLVPCILMGVAAFFHLAPWWPFVISLIFSLATFTGIPCLSTWWICLATQYGAAPIPPFWRYSWRRIFLQRWNRIRKSDPDYGNRNREENGRTIQRTYTEAPSPKEVIPLYTTSLMQFASAPLNRRGMTNVSLSVIPQVAMPSSAARRVDDFTTTSDAVYIGMSAKSNEPVFQSPADINFGIAVGGDAGSGKTNFLETLFVEYSRLSRKNDGIIGKKKSDGSRMITINPIWFETKPDQLQELIRAVNRFDPRVLTLHDKNQPTRLSLEGGRFGDRDITVKDIQRQCGLLVSAMEAIFGSSFQARSKQIANSALMTAYLCNDRDLKDLDIYTRLDNPSRPNIMSVVSYLVGAKPEVDIKTNLENLHKRIDRTFDKEQGKALRSEIFKGMSEEEARRDIERQQMLGVSVGGLLNMHNIHDAMGPIQSKIPVLAKSTGLFDTTTDTGVIRQEYSLDELFTYGGPVIVDMTAQGTALNAIESQTFIMLIHFMLWQRIQDVAGGWAGQGKYTPLFADEITNFTGRKDDQASCARLIGDIKDKGRSFGVSHNVGYQNFGQLPDDTRASILGFDSSFFFSFNGNEDQREVISQINSDRYVEANVRSFPRGVGIAYMRMNRETVPAFTIKTPLYSDWNGALSDNGEDILPSFDSIRDKEVEYMRVNKKKKVDNFSSTGDDRPALTSSDKDPTIDLLAQTSQKVSSTPRGDDDMPPLRW